MPLAKRHSGSRRSHLPYRLHAALYLAATRVGGHFLMLGFVRDNMGPRYLEGASEQRKRLNHLHRARLSPACLAGARQYGKAVSRGQRPARFAGRASALRVFALLFGGSLRRHSWMLSTRSARRRSRSKRSQTSGEETCQNIPKRTSHLRKVSVGLFLAARISDKPKAQLTKTPLEQEAGHWARHFVKSSPLSRILIAYWLCVMRGLKSS
jgi:hypothetical protein